MPPSKQLHPPLGRCISITRVLALALITGALASSLRAQTTGQTNVEPMKNTYKLLPIQRIPSPGLPLPISLSTSVTLKSSQPGNPLTPPSDTHIHWTVGEAGGGSLTPKEGGATSLDFLQPFVKQSDSASRKITVTATYLTPKREDEPPPSGEEGTTPPPPFAEVQCSPRTIEVERVYLDFLIAETEQVTDDVLVVRDEKAQPGPSDKKVIHWAKVVVKHSAGVPLPIKLESSGTKQLYFYGEQQEGKRLDPNQLQEEPNLSGETFKTLEKSFSNEDWFWIGTEEKGSGQGKFKATANAGTGFKNAPEEKTVELAPASILVDANRDGQFSSEDEGKITEEKPWRIWVNDDNDWYETGGTDIPNGDEDKRDADNTNIDQVRDLVDFFPLTLKIQDALKHLPKEQYDYSIGNPTTAIRCVWVKNHELTQSYGPCDQHHKDITYAREVSELQTIKINDAQAGRRIPDDMLTSLAAGKGLILIEGVTAKGATSMNIQIRKKNDNHVIASIELPMVISKVEDMYRTVNLMYAATEYDGTPRDRDSEGTFTRITEPPAYPDSETNGKYFVFVHGFNVSPKKSRGWNAEVFKRMHQLGSKARFVGVTWDSAEFLPNYHRAVFQAFQTGDVLGGELSSFTGNADVTIAAHSLGNMVVSHAIQDGGFLPTRYYSINAAVPREAYTSKGITNAEKRRMVESSWKSYWDYNPNNLADPPLKHLLAANWHELFSLDDHRSKLTWKNRFSSVKDRVEHYNFYSEGDDIVRDADPNRSTASVLATALSGDGFSSYSWAAQEYVKGGTSAALFVMQPTGLTQGGWGKNVTHMNFEITGNAGHYVSSTAQQAALIDVSGLIEEPFFLKFDEPVLHHPAKGKNSVGSNLAVENKVKYILLARGIPALSFAAATHSIPDTQGNFDMQGTLSTNSKEWPKEDRMDDFKKNQWLHSDMKDVAFLHVYKLYQQFITTGELNQ